MAESKDIKEINGLLEAINKNTDSKIVRLGDSKPSDKIPVVPSGVLSLDLALGVGGYPRGRVIEIYGEESGGKSALSLIAAGETQRQGGRVLWLDAENSFVRSWADKLGVNTSELYVEQPEYGEQALEIAAQVAMTKKFDLIVIDSTAALIPKEELDADIVDQQMGLQPKMMSRGLRKIVGACGGSNTTIIFINQVREKIGHFYGSPETTPGGRALKFYSHVRIRVSKGPKLKQGADKEETIIGQMIKFSVIKNKVGVPYKEGAIGLIYANGIVPQYEGFNLALELGVIDLKGRTYSFNAKELPVGSKDECFQLLMSDGKFWEEVRKRIVDEIKKATIS